MQMQYVFLKIRNLFQFRTASWKKNVFSFKCLLNVRKVYAALEKSLIEFEILIVAPLRPKSLTIFLLVSPVINDSYRNKL